MTGFSRDGTADTVVVLVVVVVGKVIAVVIGNVTRTGAGGKDVHWAAAWGNAYSAIWDGRRRCYKKEIETEGEGLKVECGMVRDFVRMGRVREGKRQ